MYFSYILDKICMHLFIQQKKQQKKTPTKQGLHMKIIQIYRQNSEDRN